MGLPQSPHEHNESPTNRANRPALSARPLLIVLFAIVVLSIAGLAQGQQTSSQDISAVRSHREGLAVTHPGRQESPAFTTIQYDGVSRVVPVASDNGHAQAAATARHAAIRDRNASRPKYAEMTAALANFDADADPDGWRVEIVLLDSRDRPVIARSNVTFELMPRIPTVDHYDYVDSARLPVRWSMSLKFDEDGVARVKLPLRESLRPIFGWPSAVYPYDVSDGNISRSREFSRLGHPIHGSWRTGSVVTREWRNQLGRPTMGEMRARVSVPGQGIFRSAVIVPIRQSTLVDTHWP